MERRKKRIVKLTAFLFLLAASIFVMPQKAFADENEDITLPTGDIKPMEPQQDESGIDTYGADEGDEFSGTEYELYTVLENRVKEAMLAGNEWVSIKDLKIRRDTYDLSFYYGYSPYFPSDTYNRIIAWYGVLMDGRGVCQSYALAYMYILNHLGIETHKAVRIPHG